MKEQTIRIEGTMNTLEQNSEVVKPHTVSVLTDKRQRNCNARISDSKFETFRALANARGLSIGGLTAILIDKYITEHVDEVLTLKRLRDKL